MILQQQIILFFKLVYVNKFNLENCSKIKLNLNSFSLLRLISSEKSLKRQTPDKFDQFLEDNFLTGRAISMTLCMKITVTIVLVLRYLPFFHII
jgi:hypothetical protein